MIPGSLGREFAGAVTSFPGLISNLPAKWSSVMDMLEQLHCFRGGPSVIFSVTLFPGLVRLRFSLLILIPGSVKGYRRSSHVVSGASPSAIFSVTLFPGRNRGNMPVPAARHGGERHIALRTTDPLVVLNWYF